MTDNLITNGDFETARGWTLDPSVPILGTLPLPDPDNRQMRLYLIRGDAANVTGTVWFEAVGAETAVSSPIYRDGPFNLALCCEDGAKICIRGDKASADINNLRMELDA